MSLEQTPNQPEPLDIEKRGSSSTIDLKGVRARLQQQQQGSAQVWRSLDEVAETPEFKDYLHREFPSNASEWLDPVGRRGFLKLMSASMALAGVTACTVQPQELIVPYVRQPEEEIPGKPLFFATAMTLGGVASGLLVESHEGRPTKIEGNPDHPSSSNPSRDGTLTSAPRTQVTKRQRFRCSERSTRRSNLGDRPLTPMRPVSSCSTMPPCARPTRNCGPRTAFASSTSRSIPTRRRRACAFSFQIRLPAEKSISRRSSLFPDRLRLPSRQKVPSSVSMG